MTYLVDANVLSEATKPSPDAKVLSWLREHETDIVIDPIILGEIQFGILLLPQGGRRQRLESWFEKGISKLVCLPWGSGTALEWARLLSKLRDAGRAIPVKDSLIAATALHHGLILVTRNVGDLPEPIFVC